MAESQTTPIVYDFETLGLPAGASFRLGYKLGRKIAAGHRYSRGCPHGTIFTKCSEPAWLLSIADDQWAFFAGLRRALGIGAILLAFLATNAHSQPNVCRTALEVNEMQDPTRSPIQVEVKPNGDVTFHFKNNNPPPITINGYEPIPNPTPGRDRNLEVYLHKRARAEHMHCLHEEQIMQHHPERYKKYLQGAPK